MRLLGCVNVVATLPKKRLIVHQASTASGQAYRIHSLKETHKIHSLIYCAFLFGESLDHNLCLPTSALFLYSRVFRFISLRAANSK